MFVFQKIGDKEIMVRSYREKPLIVNKKNLDDYTKRLITILFYAKEIPIAIGSRAYVPIVDENGIVEIQEKICENLHLSGEHIATLHHVKMERVNDALKMINQAVNDYWKKKASRAMKELMVRMPGVQDVDTFPYKQVYP